jgi:predicted Zn-dependent peptidase
VLSSGFLDEVRHRDLPMITRETLDNGIRLATETMGHVRSVSIGVWLTRGSRHEDEAQGGIAHFIEHMLFKGTTSRTAEEIAQAVDSIGGQLDAFTSKEYAGYYVKVLDEHLAIAVDLLSDLVTRPAFLVEDIEREKKVILEEIKMVEDTPDDLVHELFTQHYWKGHPLGRPILGTRETIESFSKPALRDYFTGAYVAPSFIVTAAGNLEHGSLRDLVAPAFAAVPRAGATYRESPPTPTPGVLARPKDLEQSHLCVGVHSYPQAHEDRFAAFVLNTILGGSMSSRLFQNIREKRGLAYSVFSGLSMYRDAGLASIYAGCANENVPEVLDLIVAELRGLTAEVVPDAELRRAKDHLKGNLMLSLESTSSRMTHLARQDLYFDRFYTLDETLASIEAVTGEDVLRVARDLFAGGALAATVLGGGADTEIDARRLSLG